MRKRGYSYLIKSIHFAGDLLLLNISFLLAYVYYNHSINDLHPFNDHYVFLFVAFSLLWVIISLASKLYLIERSSRKGDIIYKLVQSIIIHTLLVFAFIATIKGYYYSRGHLLTTYVVFGVLVLSWRLIFVYALQVYRKTGANYRTVVIIGAGALGSKIYKYIQSEPATGFKFLGFFDDDSKNVKHKDLILGNIQYLEEYVKTVKIDEIYYALPITPRHKLKELIKFADDHMIRMRIVPDFRGFIDKKVSVDFYNNMPVLTLRKEPMEDVFNIAIKRAFDIAFSLFVSLFILSWLLPILAFLVKISSKGPVFFKQKRTGKNNKEFYCYKLRTMYVNSEADSLQATSGDTRITPVGRFLRDFSLDELPQFFNVLLGNMTVVGPRPHMIKHTEDYSKVVDKFMVRHLVKPGITGLAQVNGYRGETDTRKMTKRINYDLWYMENWSFVLDMKIILSTIFTVFRRDKNIA